MGFSLPRESLTVLSLQKPAWTIFWVGVQFNAILRSWHLVRKTTLLWLQLELQMEKSSSECEMRSEPFPPQPNQLQASRADGRGVPNIRTPFLT